MSLWHPAAPLAGLTAWWGEGRLCKPSPRGPLLSCCPAWSAEMGSVTCHLWTSAPGDQGGRDSFQDCAFHAFNCAERTPFSVRDKFLSEYPSVDHTSPLLKSDLQTLWWFRYVRHLVFLCDKRGNHFSYEDEWVSKCKDQQIEAGSLLE